MARCSVSNFWQCMSFGYLASFPLLAHPYQLCLVCSSCHWQGLESYCPYETWLRKHRTTGFQVCFYTYRKIQDRFISEIDIISLTQWIEWYLPERTADTPLVHNAKSKYWQAIKKTFSNFTCSKHIHYEHHKSVSVDRKVKNTWNRTTIPDCRTVSNNARCEKWGANF